MGNWGQIEIPKDRACEAGSLSTTWTCRLGAVYCEPGTPSSLTCQRIPHVRNTLDRRVRAGWVELGCGFRQRFARAETPKIFKPKPTTLNQAIRTLVGCPVSNQNLLYLASRDGYLPSLFLSTARGDFMYGHMPSQLRLRDTPPPTDMSPAT